MLPDLLKEIGCKFFMGLLILIEKMFLNLLIMVKTPEIIRHVIFIRLLHLD